MPDTRPEACPVSPDADRRGHGGRCWAVGLAAITLVAVGGACSDDDDDGAGSDATAVVAIPESTDLLLVQVTPPLELGAAADPEFIGQVLADDTVTAEELTDGYGRYIDCLVEGGAVGVYAFDLDLRVAAADWVVAGAEGNDQATLDATCKRDFLGDLIRRFNEANPPTDDLAARQRASVVACVSAIDPALASEIPDVVALDPLQQGVSAIDLELDAASLGADEGEVNAVNRCTGMLGAETRQFG